MHAFHAAAVAAGGADAGAPGPRREYGERYYAAFVLDLDGHKLEAVYPGRPVSVGPLLAASSVDRVSPG